MEREQKRAEVAMRRRRGASKAQAEKINQHMMDGADLYTTCRGCGEQVTGTITEIQRHCDGCTGGIYGT